MAALPQAEDPLRAVLGDPQRHDHRPRVLDPVDQDHGDALAVEAPLGQGLHAGGRGPDELPADARLRHAEAVASHVDDLLVVAGAHAADHAAEHSLGHRFAGLEASVGLQGDLAAAVGPPHPGPVDRQLLAGERRDAPLAAVSGVRAVGPAFVPPAAEPRDLVLQDRGGDQQAQLDGQALQGVLHEGEQLVPIQRQLDLAAGIGPSGAMIGRLPLVGAATLRIGSFQGGSSSSLREKRTSSLATGREEPPLSHFNYDRDTLS